MADEARGKGIRGVVADRYKNRGDLSTFLQRVEQPKLRAGHIVEARDDLCGDGDAFAFDECCRALEDVGGIYSL